MGCKASISLIIPAPSRLGSERTALDPATLRSRGWEPEWLPHSPTALHAEPLRAHRLCQGYEFIESGDKSVKRGLQYCENLGSKRAPAYRHLAVAKETLAKSIRSRCEAEEAEDLRLSFPVEAPATFGRKPTKSD